MDNRSVAVVDSGLGGLSILQSLWQELPQENFIYLADHQFFPYGDKTKKQINQRLIKVINFLLVKNIKTIVIACNTITTNSIEFLRQLYPIPFVGTEPAVKTACRKNLKENIVVLTTVATAESNSFQNLVKKFDHQGQVVIHSCPGLVEIIETASQEKIEKELTKHLSKIKVNFSALILGCTHYILVKNLIKKILKPHVLLIEPSLAIAKQTKKVLKKNNLLPYIPSRDGMYGFLTTGDSKLISKTATNLLKQSIIFSRCSI